MKRWMKAACVTWLMACAGVVLAAAGQANTDDALHAEVFYAMNKLDFAAMDARADALLASHARLPDGRWSQQVLIRHLDDDMRYRCRIDACRRALMTAVDAYDAAHPNSQNAALFHALALEGEAWNARRDGASQEWIPIFRARMASARETLDRHGAAMAANPAWYSNRVVVSLYTDEPPQQARDILERGIRLEPRYADLYVNAIEAHLPKWGGSVQEAMSFINDYGKRAPAADGEGLYARLLWHVSCCTPGIEVDPDLDWDAARRGIDAIVRDYPAQRNIQRYFLMACRHPDKAEAAKLAAQLQDPVLDEAIGERNAEVFGLCRDWARGKVRGSALPGEERLQGLGGGSRPL